MSGVSQLASALYETLAELKPDLVEPELVHDRIVAPNQGTPIIVQAVKAP